MIVVADSDECDDEGNGKNEKDGIEVDQRVLAQSQTQRIDQISDRLNRTNKLKKSKNAQNDINPKYHQFKRVVPTKGLPPHLLSQRNHNKSVKNRDAMKSPKSVPSDNLSDRMAQFAFPKSVDSTGVYTKDNGLTIKRNPRKRRRSPSPPQLLPNRPAQSEDYQNGEKAEDRNEDSDHNRNEVHCFRSYPFPKPPPKKKRRLSADCTGIPRAAGSLHFKSPFVSTEVGTLALCASTNINTVPEKSLSRFRFKSKGITNTVSKAVSNKNGNDEHNGENSPFRKPESDENHEMALESASGRNYSPFRSQRHSLCNDSALNGDDDDDDMNDTNGVIRSELNEFRHEPSPDIGFIADTLEEEVAAEVVGNDNLETIAADIEYIPETPEPPDVGLYALDNDVNGDGSNEFDDDLSDLNDEDLNEDLNDNLDDLDDLENDQIDNVIADDLNTLSAPLLRDKFQVEDPADDLLSVNEMDCDINGMDEDIDINHIMNADVDLNDIPDIQLQDINNTISHKRHRIDRELEMELNDRNLVDSSPTSPLEESTPSTPIDLTSDELKEGVDGDGQLSINLDDDNGVDLFADAPDLYSNEKLTISDEENDPLQDNRRDSRKAAVSRKSRNRKVESLGVENECDFDDLNHLDDFDDPMQSVDGMDIGDVGGVGNDKLNSQHFDVEHAVNHHDAVISTTSLAMDSLDEIDDPLSLEDDSLNIDTVPMDVVEIARHHRPRRSPSRHKKRALSLKHDAFYLCI